MAENTVVYYGTGRRKNAVARVRIVPGTGKVTINKRDAEEYFGRHQLVEDALAPFKVTDTLGSFDVIALCDGGGITGQSGALRLGIARALLEAGDYRALAPFKVTDTLGSFDVIALCDGGGITGQSGALRLGIARALLEAGDYRA